jgi:hypothetical protein
MPAKLGDEGEPVDFIVRGVVKDVDLDEAKEELTDHDIAPGHRGTGMMPRGKTRRVLAWPSITRVLYSSPISYPDISTGLRCASEPGRR